MTNDEKLAKIHEAWALRRIDAFHAMVLVGAVLTGSSVRLVDGVLFIDGNIAINGVTTTVEFD